MRVNVEGLEARTYFNSAVIKYYGQGQAVPLEMIHDSTRAALYAINLNTIDRYDLKTGTWTTPWTFDTPLGSADITADNASLYVTHSKRVNGQGLLHRIDLDSGAVTDFPYVNHYDLVGDMVVTNDGHVLIGGGTHFTPMQSFDPATGTFEGIPAQGIDVKTLTRGADRNMILVGVYGGTKVYDAASQTFLGELDTYRGFHAVVSPDGSGIAIEGNDYGSSVVVDRSLVTTHTLPESEVPLAFDPARPVLYAINFETDRISTFDTGTWQS